MMSLQGMAYERLLLNEYSFKSNLKWKGACQTRTECQTIGTQGAKLHMNKGLLIFLILPMLIDYRILWVRNTVEMAGGWHKLGKTTVYQGHHRGKGMAAIPKKAIIIFFVTFKMLWKKIKIHCFEKSVFKTSKYKSHLKPRTPNLELCGWLEYFFKNILFIFERVFQKCFKILLWYLL